MNFAWKFQNSQIVLQSSRVVKFVVDGQRDVEVLRTRSVVIGTEVVLTDAHQDPWDDKWMKNEQSRQWKKNGKFRYNLLRR